MKLTSKSTVQNIFDQFNTQFPFLRLEFYEYGQEGVMDSTPTHQISHQTELGEINSKLVDTEVLIQPDMTVSDFEMMMKDKFDLNVQVFRKSADIWLQTSATDHWTLEKQNGKGERSTIDYDIDPIGITDFDIE